MGRSRADEGVVPRSRQSWSQWQTWVGARQMKTETVAGEGTGTHTKAGQT